MRLRSRPGLPLLILLFALSAAADAPPSTRPARLDNGWDAHWFDYDRPAKLAVEETTPTARQVDFAQRPPQLANLAEPHDAAAPAAPRAVGPADVLQLRFRDASGDDVPVLLCKPRGKKGPFPVVLAVHGVCSNKAQVCGMFLWPLARHGFAILAPDLPIHGERPGDPAQLAAAPDPAKVAILCRQAIVDLRQCIDLAESRPDLDTRHGVVLVGYSLGALLGSVAGPADDRVKAMVLLAGGTMEVPASLTILPGVRALEPQLALPHLAGRPLLMLNGTADQTITREMGERLFNAARQPKEQRWYESGHDLPSTACDEGMEWLVKTWGSIQAAAAK